MIAFAIFIALPLALLATAAVIAVVALALGFFIDKIGGK